MSPFLFLRISALAFHFSGPVIRKRGWIYLDWIENRARSTKGTGAVYANDLRYFWMSIVVPTPQFSQIHLASLTATRTQP